MKKKKNVHVRRQRRRISLLVLLILLALLGGVGVFVYQQYAATTTPSIAITDESTSSVELLYRTGNRILNTNGDQVALLRGYDESWSQIQISPTYDYISYRVNNDEFGGRSTLYTQHIERGQVHVIAEDFISTSYSWSPDGQWIAYSTATDVNNDIYINNPTGTQQIQLTHDRAVEMYPSWSPDGQHLLYTHQLDGGNWELVVVTLDTNLAITASRSVISEVFFKQVRWSPDSQWIAYQAGVPTSINDITAISLDDVVRLESVSLMSEYLGDFDWSPDSNAIIHEDDDTLYLRRFQSDERTTFAGEHIIDWLPNNQVLVTVNGTYWLIDAVTYEQTPVEFPIGAEYLGWRVN